MGAGQEHRQLHFPQGKESGAFSVPGGLFDPYPLPCVCCFIQPLVTALRILGRNYSELEGGGESMGMRDRSLSEL